MKKCTYFIFFWLFNSIINAQSVLDKYGDRIELLGVPFRGPMELCQILIAIFLSIAFLQSGLDKVTDRKGNLEFLNIHFGDSLLLKTIRKGSKSGIDFITFTIYCSVLDSLKVNAIASLVFKNPSSISSIWKMINLGFVCNNSFFTSTE